MSDAEIEPKPSVADFFTKELDKKYYWGAGIGAIILIITLILTGLLRGTTPWLEIFAYPLLVYFITQQVLSGFGFITGYIPIAQHIINWLTKTSKKKAYSEKEAAKWEETIQDLEKKEEKEEREIEKKEKEAEKKENQIREKKESGKWKGRKLKREEGKLEKLKVEIVDDKESLEEHVTKEKDELKGLQKQYRGKMSEKIITRQEDLEPRRFKLIMLVPLYFMLVLGLGLALFSIITTSIHWARGDFADSFISTTESIIGLDALHTVNEIYKGIMAVVSIVFMLIVPAIRTFRTPEKEYKVIYKEEVEKRRRFAIFRRRKKKDHRSLLNRQFEDLRKYYWSIKQRLKNALLIPIGMSMLIVAPLGGTSIVLGAKTTFQRKKMVRYELVLQIIIAFVLIGMVAVTYFSFFAQFIRGIPIIALITKLIYISMLIYSFVLFTRQPIHDLEEE
ncbi:MAG: hypothetical protein ACTSXA_13775 [Candidatus Heimdallarchaeota archaeon]